MSRIAAVVGPDPGHALPVLGLGAELVARGHDVTVWTGTRHHATAAQHGIAWRELPLLAPTPGDHDLGHRMWGRAGPMAAALHPELAAFDPDLLVVDTLTTSGALVAGRLERPHVEVVPHHLVDPAPDLPPVGLGRRPARTPLRRWDDRRIAGFQAASLAAGRAQADEVARAAGLASWPRPALRLLQTLPSLERPRAHWPADAVVVGTLALDPPGAPLDPPPGDEPLVVVTDSTASGERDGLAEVALRDLHATGLRVVATSGRLPPRRDGWTVVGTGPHRPLFAQADVVVSPGGGGVVTKAAAAGVPHLVVHGPGDQREAAARVVDTGAGGALRPSRCTPRRLRHATVRLVADRRARDAAARLAVEAAALGPRVAADRCEDLLGVVPR
jgi:UDP:flavonoid glycosyltransferase YjiC (YdhE family)